MSASWKAWRANCSSNALRSEVSRKTITAPDGVEPPTTGEAVTATGKWEPSGRSNRVSWMVTLRRREMARMAGSSRKRGVSPADSNGRSPTVFGPSVYQPSMLAPAGFMNVTSPLSLMAQTPSPRLLVMADRCSCWRCTSP